MSVLNYLKQNLDVDGDFMSEYRRLSDKERISLKAYAVFEMLNLNIEVK
jgi:hypothetical protein